MIWQTSLMSRCALFSGWCAVVGCLGFSSQQTWSIVVWSWGLFLHQSYDVLILYKKDFVFSLLVELSAVAILALTIIWVGKDLSLDLLVLLFGVVTLGKATACVLRFHDHGTRHYRGRFDIQYFRLALPFFARVQRYTAITNGLILRQLLFAKRESGTIPSVRQCHDVLAKPGRVYPHTFREKHVSFA